MSTIPNLDPPAQVYSDILDSMEDAVLSFSLLERRLIYGSPSVETILGRPMRAFLDDPELFKRIVPPDELEFVLAAYDQAVRAGQAELDHRLIWPDGQLRWVHHRLWVNRDVHRHPIRINEVIRDITERKQAQAAVQESEETHRLILSSISDAVFLTDMAGKFSFICPNVSVIFGYTAAEVEALGTISALFGANLVDVDRLRADGEITNIEHDIRRPSGEVRHLLINVKHSALKQGEILYSCRDVTERKQAEAALRASEARYRGVVESTDSSVVLVDALGHMLFINSVGKRAINLSDDRYIGKSLHDFFPSEVVDARLKVVQAVIETGTGRILEEVRILDGEQRWYRISVQAVHDASAPAPLALINVSDITPLKQAEAALRQSNRLFSSFMEQLSAGTFIQNHEGRIQYCNSINARSFHLTPDEIAGRLPEDYASPEQAQLIRDENRRLLESGLPSMEFAYQGERNGKYHFWRILKFLIPQEQGLPLIGGISINITKEKQAESALQTLNEQLEQRVAERTIELERAKDRLEAIFNHSGDGIVLLDVKCAVLQANFAFEALFGVAGVVDVPFMTCFHPESASRLETAVQEVAASHETQHIEACARGADGSYFDVEISLAPVNRSGRQVSNLVCIIRDVRQRKLAEAALRRSEERLSMMLAGTRAGTWEWFVQTGETTFNERWAEIVGYTLEELAPITISTWVNLAHPDDLQRSEQLLQQHFAGELDYYDCEVRMKHKAGHWVWVWDRGQVMEWTPDGKPVRMLGTHVEITSTKGAQQAIAEERNLLRAIIDAVPNFIYVKDRDHRFSLCNRAYAEYHGNGDPVALIGKTDADLFLPHDAARFLEQDEQILESGISLSDLETEYLQVGSRHNWTLTNKVPLRNLDGEVIGVLGVTHDVTAIKMHEEALRISETRYRTTISAMSEGIVMQDADGVIQVCNAAASTILGLSMDEMRGRTSFDEDWQAIHEDGTPFPGEFHPAMVTLQTGTPQANVIMGVRKPNGDLSWLSINTQAVINPGDTKPTAVVSTFEDITAQRLVEAEMRQKRHEERRMQGYLKALHNSTIRLTRAENLDAFYRTAVEEALAHFDYERVGLLLYDPQDGSATGTYGTDEHGQLVAEYHLRIDPGSLTGILKRTLDREERFAFDEQAQLYANLKPMGVGHNAVAALWNGEALGWLAVDNGVRHRPITKAQLDILALYALTVGALLARKRAEFALRDSEQRYRLLAENIKDVIVKLSPEGVFTFVTPSVYGLTAHRPEELIGYSAQAHVHPDDVSVSASAFRQALASGATFFTLQQRLRHSDGHYVWVEITNTVVREAASGKPLELIGIIHDITQRMRAEEALRQSEQRYRLLAENIQDVIIKQSLDTTFTFVSPSSYALAGYQPDELIGRSGLMLVHPDDQATSIRLASEATARGATYFKIEERILHKLGQIIWVEIAYTVVRDPVSGAPLEFIGILHDITARKAAEDALRESEARYQSVVQTQSELICRYQPDLTLSFVNRAYCRYFGKTPDELIGRSFLELIPEAQHADIRALHAELVRTRGTTTYEHQVIRPDGSMRWQVWTDQVIVDDHNEVSAIQAIGTDITERKAAEEALRASEVKFRQFIESAPLACVISDRSGKIVLVNKEAEKLFGYEREELIGQMIEGLVPDTFRPDHNEQRHASTITEKRRMEAVEVAGRRKDGREFPAEIQLSFVDMDSAPLVMSFVIDITERKQAEVALKQALAQEKELGELKTRFVSMASHEFRTPLAAILATVETLTIYRDRMDSAQLDARLNKIRHQVAYMKGIMDDVLQLARIQAGRVEFRPERGDLQRLCREVVEEFESQLLYQQRIRYVAPDDAVVAWFDERLMRQIISNLISNALKYSPDERPIDVRLTQDAHTVTFSVQDAGIGIPPDDLKHLFEPFHRAANVGTISGTGLGLSITKQAVELHHGSITPESQLDVGTTFIVVFPKELAQATDPAANRFE